MNEQVEFVTMSNREKYLFDLQGFLVVKDFLSNTEVCALNEAIDANHDKRREHPKADLNGTLLDGEFGPFWHYNGMLTWLPPLVPTFPEFTRASQGYPLPQHLTWPWLETGSFCQCSYRHKRMPRNGYSWLRQRNIQRFSFLCLPKQ